MSEDNFHGQDHQSARHHHIHYHYHYHYPETSMTESRASNYSHHQPIGSPRHLRNPQNGPEYRSFISSPKQWKSHVNPEINKMYQEYRFNQSSLSQIKPQIFEENEDYETPSPIKSEVLKTPQQSNSQVSLKKLIRLDQLYKLKRGSPAEEREEVKSQRTGVTSLIEMSAELKLREYQRQIQRLRRYEQECQYLRGRFYKHAVTRHSDEIEK